MTTYILAAITILIGIGFGVYVYIKSKKPNTPTEPAVEKPVDWEDAAYLYHFKDKKPPIAESEYKDNPYKHWLDWGQAAGWQWKPDGWKSSEYLRLNPDVAAAGVAPLLHYWQYGEKEGRKYRDFAAPTVPGLHLILDNQGSQRFYFTGLRFKDGLLLGDYGGGIGGAKVTFYDGTTIKEEALFNNPEAESVFHIIMADDGAPICSNERYGMMHKRQPDGKWKMTNGPVSPMPFADTDLCFGIYRLGKTLWCYIHTFGDSTGDGISISSDDNGNSWRRGPDHGLKFIYCGNSDGQRILLVGQKDNYPIVYGLQNDTVLQRTDLQGQRYAQVSGKNGKWIFAGDNFNSKGLAFLDYWEGGVPKRVFTSSRPFCMWTEIDPVTNYWIALFSVWQTTEFDSAQVAISKDEGKKWSELCIVPTPCIQGLQFADGGVYLFGGKYRDYGRVYFYKF